MIQLPWHRRLYGTVVAANIPETRVSVIELDKILETQTIEKQLQIKRKVLKPKQLSLKYIYINVDTTQIV